jgi:hypothetical protein
MKNNKVGSDNLLLIIAVIAVTVSIMGAGLTYNYLNSFRNKLTGFATTGIVNLSVESVMSINFTTSIINWGSGRVNDGQANATLDTSRSGSTNVTNGNWTGNTAGFVVENIGNKNVTMNISFGKDAAGLLGGGSPRYQYNVTNNEGIGGCLNSTGGTDDLVLGTFMTANTTITSVCPKFLYDDTRDVIRVDLKLVIPSDSKTGTLTDTITATFSEVN